MNIKKRIQKIEKLQEDIDVPWEVMRTGISPQLWGDQLLLTKWSSADYVSLEEARAAVKWLADQLGYAVTDKNS